MWRQILYLFASIALVCAQNTTVNDSTGNSTTHSPPTTASIKPSAQTTTTVAPTTTTKNPTTTVPSKTTTITPKPTPAPTPVPIPAVEPFRGNVTEEEEDKSNNTCINVQFGVKITMKYNTTDKVVVSTGFIIPSNASVNSQSSHCSQVNKTNSEAITIRFDNTEHTSATLTITFNKNDTNVFVEDIALSFKATQDLFPGLDSKLIGTTVKVYTNDTNLFKVAKTHAYTCSAVQSAKLDLGGVDNIHDVLIEFTDSKVEAYIDKSKKGVFDSEIDCKSADISDVVPIAVGAALAGLVIIVLIAYFVGRRRSRRLAYQSV